MTAELIQPQITGHLEMRHLSRQHFDFCPHLTDLIDKRRDSVVIFARFFTGGKDLNQKQCILRQMHTKGQHHIVPHIGIL